MIAVKPGAKEEKATSVRNWQKISLVVSSIKLTTSIDLTNYACIVQEDEGPRFAMVRKEIYKIDKYNGIKLKWIH